jgi:thiol-disulfide isomerase/thioredoxin
MKILLALLFGIACTTATSQTVAKWKISDYENYIAASKEDILVINFWATFCKPCLEEIPHMIQVVKEYQKEGVKMMLVSVDAPSKYASLASFARKRKWDAGLAWLNESDADYFCPKVDKAWSGSIPATVIINNKNGKRHFVEGEMTAGEFEQLIKKVL